ncbi:hypothetical protein EYF80_034612 [Liparis tanakae]|uniref:Uncharacterized protein n=1 Tax=Liparis tanakae TaxID=230148 RepID=A0A4Z2GNN7_9TELE|nr:hypothetical protein EYF80_034612 [Liparis tanakae]
MSVLGVDCTMSFDFLLPSPRCRGVVSATQHDGGARRDTVELNAPRPLQSELERTERGSNVRIPVGHDSTHDEPARFHRVEGRIQPVRGPVGTLYVIGGALKMSALVMNRMMCEEQQENSHVLFWDTDSISNQTIGCKEAKAPHGETPASIETEVEYVV